MFPDVVGKQGTVRSGCGSVNEAGKLEGWAPVVVVLRYLERRPWTGDGWYGMVRDALRCDAV